MWPFEGRSIPNVRLPSQPRVLNVSKTEDVSETADDALGDVDAVKYDCESAVGVEEAGVVADDSLADCDASHPPLGPRSK